MKLKWASAAAAGVIAATAFTATASAGDLFGRRAEAGSIKDAPAAPARRCEFSANIGATSDYIFRGFSQSAEDPAVQGGVDATCGMFYAGTWASNIDFGDDDFGRTVAPIEVDIYAGITPKLGNIDFDLGVIYYAYPGAEDDGAELDYVEIKGGASTTIQKFSIGGTLYYSPEYTGETGATLFPELSLGYELPRVGIFTPSITGLVGAGYFLDEEFEDLEYVYWNAGLALAVENVTLDFRYWDTDISDDACQGPIFACDSRFVFSASVSLP